MAILEVQHEQLTHFAQFSRPLFEIWGNGKEILKGVYNAFQPLGATVANIKVEGSGPSDHRISVDLGNVNHAFRFDRLETTFINPSEDAFGKIPAVLDASLAWVRTTCPDVPVSGHRFVHFTHSKIKDATLMEVLSRVGPKAPLAGGLSQGNGAIFHWTVPQKHWITALTIDKSVAVKDGMFVMLSLGVPLDKIDYGSIVESGRSYLLGVLKELGLEVPAFEAK